MDASGSIDNKEWISWWLRRIGNYPYQEEQSQLCARSTFQKFDSDNNGDLSREEIEGMLDYLGANPTDDDIIHMFEALDKDHDGKVSEDEFVHFWTHSLKDKKCREMRYLLKKKCETDIFEAIWEENEAMVRSFLDLHKDMVNARDASDFGFVYVLM